MTAAPSESRRKVSGGAAGKNESQPAMYSSQSGKGLSGKQHERVEDGAPR